MRRRAIEGWEEVVAAWQLPGCRTAEDRIEAEKEVQADAEVRFGDIELFEALAGDAARCVWVGPQGVDASMLKNFVAATEALSKQRRFKGPAFLPPAALLHPRVCDFLH